MVEKRQCWCGREIREQLRKTSVHRRMRARREEGMLHVRNVSSPRREEQKFPDLLALWFGFS